MSKVFYCGHLDWMLHELRVKDFNPCPDPSTPRWTVYDTEAFLVAVELSAGGWRRVAQISIQGELLDHVRLKYPTD